MSTTGQDVFLSYSREDQATARRYAEAFEREGFSVWWDQALAPGEAFDQVTEKALDDAGAVVVLWSRTSVNSRWVRAEATQANANGRLMPVTIEPCKRPIMFELTQTSDLSHWNGDANDPAWRNFIVHLRRLVQRGQPPPVSPQAVAVTESRRPGRRQIAAAVGIVAAAAAIFGWYRISSVQESRTTIAQVAALVDAGDMRAAFEVAQQLRASDRALLKTFSPLYAATFSITSEPSGADVSYRSYDAPDAAWQRLGHTPLKNVQVPRQASRWLLEVRGYEPVELATAADSTVNALGMPVHDEARPLDVTLLKSGELPAGMVAIPAGRSALVPRLGSVEVPAFFVDRFEVTNAQYKDFVDAGGYERRAFWEGLDFRKDGKSLSIEQAMQLFRDATGRPGPANWELGSYPQGRADYPVTGISWYEASAYARFRGASLPTAFHWTRAAMPQTEQFNSLAVSIIPLSNFGSDGPLPIGRKQGFGPYGTYDMFGNAREWMANAGSGHGLLMGGGWIDAPYSYNYPAHAMLFDRSEVNGFRLMKDGPLAYDTGLSAPRELGSTSARVDAKPVSEEAFATLRQQLDYRQGPLNASAPETMETTEEWSKQRVTIDTGYENKRMDVILFVPRSAPGPFQPVIFFSGAGEFRFPSSLERLTPGFEGISVDFVIRSGRMLVYPVYEGSVNRFNESFRLDDAMILSRLVTAWRADLGRTIDYLQTRPDVDIQRLGYLGVSLGGMSALPAMTVEPRIKAAVLISGGLPPNASTLTPLTDPVNFAPRIRIPVLMFNGRYDPYLTVEASQQPLFRLLGSPPADKRYVQADYAHVSPPRAELLRETLGWYDKYLGEVRR